MTLMELLLVEEWLRGVNDDEDMEKEAQNSCYVVVTHGGEWLVNTNPTVAF